MQCWHTASLLPQVLSLLWRCRTLWECCIPTPQRAMCASSWAWPETRKPLTRWHHRLETTLHVWCKAHQHTLLLACRLPKQDLIQGAAQGYMYLVLREEMFWQNRWAWNNYMCVWVRIYSPPLLFNLVHALLCLHWSRLQPWSTTLSVQAQPISCIIDWYGCIAGDKTSRHNQISSESHWTQSDLLGIPLDVSLTCSSPRGYQRHSITDCMTNNFTWLNA